MSALKLQFSGYFLTFCNVVNKIIFSTLLCHLGLGNCVHFVIDVVDEILILFENVYEIYGDIQGASNSFKINAYEQGKNG